jgi:transposase
MLNDATCFKQIYLVTGYTDLRSGIDRLAGIIETQTGIDPFSPDTLYLFCGRKADRIKGLVWEKDGYISASQLVNINGLVMLQKLEF